jgi:predicted transcriptional regulator
MRKTNRVQVHVGSLDDMGKRFSSAWNRAAAGKKVDETHTTFLDIKTMLDTLSPRRLEMLKFVRQCGAGSIKELAVALDRDYKNVHQDVCVLESAGLLIREGRKLHAPWDEVSASVSLAM